MTKTTKTSLTYKGQPLTEERAEQIADDTLAELAAMSDEEVDARKRIGRPPVDDQGSSQVQFRLAHHTIVAIDIIAERQHQSRSELLRDAIDEYLAHHR
jgi:hypothetical protein